MGDDSNRTSHLIKTQVPSTSMDISGRELIDATMGQHVLNQWKVGIKMAGKEPSVVQPHNINASLFHQLNNLMKEKANATVDNIAERI